MAGRNAFATPLNRLDCGSCGPPLVELRRHRPSRPPSKRHGHLMSIRREEHNKDQPVPLLRSSLGAAAMNPSWRSGPKDFGAPFFWSRRSFPGCSSMLASCRVPRSRRIHGASAAFAAGASLLVVIRGKRMRMIVKGAMVAGLMALGACNNSASEKAADNVEAVADKKADVLEEPRQCHQRERRRRVGTSRRGRGRRENKADAIRGERPVSRPGPAAPAPVLISSPTRL